MKSGDFLISRFLTNLIGKSAKMLKNAVLDVKKFADGERERETYGSYNRKVELNENDSKNSKIDRDERSAYTKTFNSNITGTGNQMKRNHTS